MTRKNLTDNTPIENKALKNTTYCKRKRGFIKKAMELSMLCSQKISVVIYDSKKNKVVSYCSTDFDHQTAANLVQLHFEKNNKKFESYTNKDFYRLCGVQTMVMDKSKETLPVSD